MLFGAAVNVLNCVTESFQRKIILLFIKNKNLQGVHMKNYISRKHLAGLLISVLFISFAHAYTDAEQYNVDRLVNGGSVSIRTAAKNLYHTGESNPKVLDVLAEVVLQNYQKSDRNSIDAISWACKALGNSGLSRYRSVLEEVQDKGSHRKLRGYAKKSLAQLGNDGSAQYQRGMVSLEKLKQNPSKTASTPKPVQPVQTQAPTGNGNFKPITEVKVGMGMEQAYALVGQPTATTSYQTGKAWIPFNFKGSDVARIAALYKGQGRIVFSNDNAYSASWRVLEVLVDPNESGYP